jgi:hypothetical protein
MTDIGPVQLLALGFGPDARYEGQLIDELERLEGKGLVRVLDLLFLGQDLETDEIVALDYQGDDLGALVGALLAFEFVGAGPPVETVAAPVGEATVGITRDRLEAMIAATPPDVAIALVLIEHVWARDLKGAMRAAGAVPLAEGFLSPETLAGIAVELEITSQIIDELEREQDVAASAAG